jgi:acid phosphatase (class A)
MKMPNLPLRKHLFVLLAIAITAGCASTKQQSGPMAVPEIHPGILAGYLQPEELPNSLDLVPPPPAAGSAALALDEEVSRRSLALHGTPRWDLAANDAELMFPEAAGTFSCALGISITERTRRTFICCCGAPWPMPGFPPIPPRITTSASARSW